MLSMQYRCMSICTGYMKFKYKLRVAFDVLIHVFVDRVCDLATSQLGVIFKNSSLLDMYNVTEILMVSAAPASVMSG